MKRSFVHWFSVVHFVGSRAVHLVRCELCVTLKSLDVIYPRINNVTKSGRLFDNSKCYPVWPYFLVIPNTLVKSATFWTSFGCNEFACLLYGCGFSTFYYNKLDLFWSCRPWQLVFWFWCNNAVFNSCACFLLKMCLFVADRIRRVDNMVKI